MTPATFISFVPLLLGLFAADPGAIPVDGVASGHPGRSDPARSGPAAAGSRRSSTGSRRKGPKCIPAGAIRRASLSGPEQVDLILSGGGRVRAKFDEDCPALDFYGGFYLQGRRPSQICVHRDAVLSRIGGSCEIERFRILIPKFRH